MQQLLKSRTVKLAIIQAIGGIAIAVFTDLDMIGYVGIVKSLVDISLRMVTTKPIAEK
ncbi:MAG: hypothetical protein HN802_05835 [Candidatus Jacksonbacteria bacterium]|jgi:hypothetical protein|nr:hypothetical protein [Candidatus Jacksonbacteria bacterium]